MSESKPVNRFRPGIDIVATIFLCSLTAAILVSVAIILLVAVFGFVNPDTTAVEALREFAQGYSSVLEGVTDSA